MQEEPSSPPPTFRPADATVVPSCPLCGYPAAQGACTSCHGRLLDAPDGRPLPNPPRRGVAAVDLVRGFRAFVLGGLLLFTRPQYAGLLKLPIVANLVVVPGLAIGGWLFFGALLAPAAGETDLLGWFPGSLATLMTLLSVLCLAPPLAELVLGPFLEPLAEVTERATGGDGMRARHAPGAWVAMKQSARSAAQMTMIAGAVWLLTLVLAIVGIGVVLGALAAALIAAATWLDIPCARRGWDLRRRLLLLRHNWARATGFGLAFLIGALIPVFNMLLLAPAAAVGATLLFQHMEKGAALPTMPACPRS